MATHWCYIPSITGKMEGTKSSLCDVYELLGYPHQKVDSGNRVHTHIPLRERTVNIWLTLLMCRTITTSDTKNEKMLVSQSSSSSKVLGNIKCTSCVKVYYSIKQAMNLKRMIYPLFSGNWHRNMMSYILLYYKDNVYAHVKGFNYNDLLLPLQQVPSVIPLVVFC